MLADGHLVTLNARAVTPRSYAGVGLTKPTETVPACRSGAASSDSDGSQADDACFSSRTVTTIFVPRERLTVVVRKTSSDRITAPGAQRHSHYRTDRS